MAITIPSGITTLFNEGVDAIIEGLGRPCKLVYPPKQTPCANCILDSIAQKSSGRYNNSGPVPFPFGAICPWCNGVGYLVEDSFDIIKVCIYWSVKDWIKLNVQLESGKTYIQILAYLSDLPNINRANELWVHNDVSTYGTWRFKRLGEMVPSGLGWDRYTVGFWERVG